MNTIRDTLAAPDFLTAARDPGLRVYDERQALAAWALFDQTGRFIDLHGGDFAAPAVLKVRRSV